MTRDACRLAADARSLGLLVGGQRLAAQASRMGGPQGIAFLARRLHDKFTVMNERGEMEDLAGSRAVQLPEAPQASASFGEAAQEAWRALMSDKAPKGFEHFRPRGKGEPEVESKPPSGEGNDGGNNDKKKKDGGPGDGGGWEQHSLVALALVVTFFLLEPYLAGMLRTDAREINFQDFVNGPFANGRVHHLQVINQKFVRVFLRSDAIATAPIGQGGDEDRSHSVGGLSTGSPPVYWFSIGSVDSFERKMAELQTSYNIEVKDQIPILYSNEVSILAEVAKLAPTLLIMGLMFFAVNRMMSSMGGGGGGGPGNIFRVGKAKPTIIKNGGDKKIT